MLKNVYVYNWHKIITKQKFFFSIVTKILTYNRLSQCACVWRMHRILQTACSRTTVHNKSHRWPTHQILDRFSASEKKKQNTKM